MDTSHLLFLLIISVVVYLAVNALRKVVPKWKSQLEEAEKQKAERAADEADEKAEQKQARVKLVDDTYRQFWQISRSREEGQRFGVLCNDWTVGGDSVGDSKVLSAVWYQSDGTKILIFELRIATDPDWRKIPHSAWRMENDVLVSHGTLGPRYGYDYAQLPGVIADLKQHLRSIMPPDGAKVVTPYY